MNLCECSSYLNRLANAVNSLVNTLISNQQMRSMPMNDSGNQISQTPEISDSQSSFNTLMFALVFFTVFGLIIQLLQRNRIGENANNKQNSFKQ